MTRLVLFTIHVSLSGGKYLVQGKSKAGTGECARPRLSMCLRLMVIRLAVLANFAPLHPSCARYPLCSVARPLRNRPASLSSIWVLGNLNLNLLHEEGFDDVALLDILELLEGNAAFPHGIEYPVGGPFDFEMLGRSEFALRKSPPKASILRAKRRALLRRVLKRHFRPRSAP